MNVRSMLPAFLLATLLLVAKIVAAPAAVAPIATLSGRVVSFDDGRPIANATISGNPGWDVAFSARSDAQGRFSIELPAGRYRVRASANGYASTEFAEEPNIGGTWVVVGGQTPAGDLDFKLHRGGTIAGVVTNDLKEPVVNAEVRAAKPATAPQRWSVTSARTDDRGAFRLIGLVPGDYFVGVKDGLGITYAPEAVTIATAQRISLALDGEATTAIRTRPSPSGGIEGAMAGLPNVGATVSLLREGDDAGFWPMPGVRTIANRFSFADVPVGRYALIVRPGLVNSPPRAWGREAVTVTAGVASTPTITLREGGKVSGQFVGPEPAHGPLEIAPVGTDHPEAVNVRGSLGPASTFVISNVAPGTYRWVQTQQMGRWLLSVMLKDEDIADLPLIVGPDTAIENLRVALNEPAKISGTVKDVTGAIVTTGAIVVAAVENRYWLQSSRRVRVVRADTAGHFEVTGLPAGRYRVNHVERLAAGQLWDQAFLRTLAQSREVTLAAGGSTTVELRLK